MKKSEGGMLLKTFFSIQDNSLSQVSLPIMNPNEAHHAECLMC